MQTKPLVVGRSQISSSNINTFGPNLKSNSILSNIAIRWNMKSPSNHGRRKRGYAGDLTPQLFMWGDIDMYIPVEKCDIKIRNKYITHANYMQHVLRWWEMQSDGAEYKKTLRRPGLCPGPRWGSLQRSRKPPSWWGGAGCSLPKNPNPALGPAGLASPTRTPKWVLMPLHRTLSIG